MMTPWGDKRKRFPVVGHAPHDISFVTYNEEKNYNV